MIEIPGIDGVNTPSLDVKGLWAGRLGAWSAKSTGPTQNELASQKSSDHSQSEKKVITQNLIQVNHQFPPIYIAFFFRHTQVKATEKATLGPSPGWHLHQWAANESGLNHSGYSSAATAEDHSPRVTGSQGPRGWESQGSKPSTSPTFTNQQVSKDVGKNWRYFYDINVVILCAALFKHIRTVVHFRASENGRLPAGTKNHPWFHTTISCPHPSRIHWLQPSAASSSSHFFHGGNLDLRSERSLSLRGIASSCESVVKMELL